MVDKFKKKNWVEPAQVDVFFEKLWPQLSVAKKIWVDPAELDLVEKKIWSGRLNPIFRKNVVILMSVADAAWRCRRAYTNTCTTMYPGLCVLKHLNLHMNIHTHANAMHVCQIYTRHIWDGYD